jgi:hypothetical protein
LSNKLHPVIQEGVDGVSKFLPDTFSKLIILYLQQSHNIHPRPESSVHLAIDEHCVGNLKFVAKGTDQEMFGMDIPDALLTSNILDAPYYKNYLSKVAAFRKQSTTKSTADKPASKKRKVVSTTEVASSGTKKHKTIKTVSKTGSKKTKKVKATVLDDNPHEMLSPTEAADIQKAVEESLKTSETHPGPPLTGVSIKEPVPEKIMPLPDTIGKGKNVVSDEQAAHTLLHISSPASKLKEPRYEFKRRSPESSKPKEVSSEDTLEQPQSHEPLIESSDSESDLNVSKKEKETPITTTGDTTSKDLPPPVFGPTTEPHSTLQDDFVASIYPGVQENLKMKSDEQKLIIEPDTSTGTLSSYKQFDHEFTYGDHDADDNPEGKETAKPTNESEAISMVDVPIEQYESTIPTVTLPIPTNTSSKDTSTAAATTTISPSTVENLSTQVEKPLSTAERANMEIVDIKSTLEKHRGALKDLQKLDLHQVIHHQASRISKLESLNINAKVQDAVDDQVSFAVKQAMDAPLKARFKDLSTYDMKDLLLQRMFQTDHHKEHEAHQ